MRKVLQQTLSRRNFFKLTARLSMLTVGLGRINLHGKVIQQTNAQLYGYGLGAYGQGTYPAGISKTAQVSKSTAQLIASNTAQIPLDNTLTTSTNHPETLYLPFVSNTQK